MANNSIISRASVPKVLQPFGEKGKTKKKSVLVDDILKREKDSRDLAAKLTMVKPQNSKSKEKKGK